MSIRWYGMDLTAVTLDRMDFTIGASFYISTPTYKLRSSDDRWYRCLSISIGIGPFYAAVNIPLWFEFEAGEPK